MTTMERDRRRSGRIWLTVPIRAEGAGEDGQAIEYPGRAFNLSRHGGRLVLPQRLDPNQSLRLRSPIGGFEADFRVVETISNNPEDGCECGVECLNEDCNFWGIEFRPHDGDSGEEANALLVCRSCQTVALVPLKFLEVLALNETGMVSLNCPKCGLETSWQYADLRERRSRELVRSMGAYEGHPSWIVSHSGSGDRGHRRFYAQIPIGIHDSRGLPDDARTENISDCGFCFSSTKDYWVGEHVRASFPIASMTPLTQRPARVVRQQVFEKSPSRLYGAVFIRAGSGFHLG